MQPYNIQADPPKLDTWNPAAQPKPPTPGSFLVTGRRREPRAARKESAKGACSWGPPPCRKLHLRCVWGCPLDPGSYGIEPLRARLVSPVQAAPVRHFAAAARWSAVARHVNRDGQGRRRAGTNGQGTYRPPAGDPEPQAMCSFRPTCCTCRLWGIEYEGPWTSATSMDLGDLPLPKRAIGVQHERTESSRPNETPVGLGFGCPYLRD